MAETPTKVIEKAQRTKRAAQILQNVPTALKNQALKEVQRLLIEKKEQIRAANLLDLEKAKVAVSEGSLSSSLFKRLDLFGQDGEKFNALHSGIDDVIRLEDPTGKVTLATKMDDGLELYRVTCPVGVLCIIFEARPEVNIQISALALKSGNAVILKGGSEAANSNRILVEIFREAIGSVEGIPADTIQFVSSREAIDTLLQQDRFVDLVIPRGSAELVRSIKTRSRIPVLGHADGICSVYLDKQAGKEKAVKVVVDSKTNYVAACNSAETLLVHQDLLGTPVFSEVIAALLKAGVKLRAHDRVLRSLEPNPAITAATDSDFSTEFMELTMAVKAVSSIDEAIEHINFHGSHHTDSIVTEDEEAAEKFMSLVDSGGVYHNASTRLADGFRYGFGAEIGVSTNKTHARGPVGLEGLVIYKYRIYGTGQGAGMFGSGEGKRKFIHAPISEAEYHKRLKTQ